MKNLLIIIFLFTSIYFLLKKESHPSFDSPIKVNNNHSVNLIGLNEFNSEYLKKAKKIIEDNFNIRCEIKKPLKIDYSESNFDCGKAQLNLGYSPYKSHDDDLDVNVFITNENLYSVGQKVRGVCYGNQIYIEQYSGFSATVVHELLHSFGLEHCKNECIMNSMAKNRWNSKSNTPIYCSDCESKLP